MLYERGDLADYRAKLQRALGRRVGTSRAALLEGALARLATSDAYLVAADLDDLLGETTPHNIPGKVLPTIWRRRLRRPTSETLADPTVRRLLAILTERGHAMTRPASRASSTSTCSTRAPTGASTTSSAPTPTTTAAGSPCGRRTPAPSTSSATSPAGSNRSPSSRWPSRASGRATSPRAEVGHGYRFGITGADGERDERADPVAAATFEPPSTASRIADLDVRLGRRRVDGRSGRRPSPPMRRSRSTRCTSARGAASPPRGGGGRRYDELADPLADHVLSHGFTHVELLPVMEHPFYGSWGYQVTGYFAPTARYGDPTDLMRMIDRLHERGVGVLLDWVPSHFPMDEHALFRFDGTYLYEHADPRQGYHPDWKSAIFNYGRPEVRSFLVSSAISWLERYHADGLRVDAVASMLYLDYSRSEGQWVPNRFGGRENLAAIDFLKQCNTAIAEEFPDTATFAEESTAWPQVTGAVANGGLGFGFKWDMGWMHDVLQYQAREPVHRRFHHDEVTFRSMYAFSERYVLPLSHDEVVHGKGSLLGKMPGDEWQRFANLRMLYGTMWGQPGKKLLFMGGELATLGGVGPRGDARLGAARRRRPRRRAPPRRRPQRRLPARAGAPSWRLRRRRVPLRRRRRRHAQRVRLAPPRPARRGAGRARRRQRHAGRALRLPDRRARGRRVDGDPQHRRRPTTAAAASATSASS